MISCVKCNRPLPVFTPACLVTYIACNQHGQASGSRQLERLVRSIAAYHQYHRLLHVCATETLFSRDKPSLLLATNKGLPITD